MVHPQPSLKNDPGDTRKPENKRYLLPARGGNRIPWSHTRALPRAAARPIPATVALRRPPEPPQAATSQGKQQRPSVAGAGVECGMGRRRACLGQRAAAERHRPPPPAIRPMLPTPHGFNFFAPPSSNISCTPTAPFLFPCSSSCCTEPSQPVFSDSGKILRVCDGARFLCSSTLLRRRLLPPRSAPPLLRSST
jgi:hypothetical protein